MGYKGLNVLIFIVGCTSKVKLDFGQSFEANKNPVYVVNQNVDVSNGIAKFDGKSLLRVPQLSNVDLGGTVVLRLRIKDTNKNKRSASARPQAIISNGDCGNNASLLVAKENDAIIFGAKADGGQFTSFEIPSPVRKLDQCKISRKKGRRNWIINF